MLNLSAYMLSIFVSHSPSTVPFKQVVLRFQTEQTLGNIMSYSLYETNMDEFDNVREYCSYLAKMFKRLRKFGTRISKEDEITITLNGLSEDFDHFLQHCDIPFDGIETKHLHELLDKYEDVHLLGYGLYEWGCHMCDYEEQMKDYAGKKFLNRINNGMTFKLYTC
jgi:hypothetical protein